MSAAAEFEACEEYLRKSKDEILLTDYLERLRGSTTVIAMQGFEQRTCGVLRAMARMGQRPKEVVIARYVKRDGTSDDVNTREFTRLAKSIAPANWRVVQNHNDGGWVSEALENAGETVLIDITGTSSRAMFQILDSLEKSGRRIHVAYTEALSYWPRKQEWIQLKKKLTKHQNIAELVDKKPWMFGHEHHIELISGHEGYDASGTGRALVAFLPYKCSRLAAILSDEDYAEKIFIAGRPLSSDLAWRVNALKEINETLTRGSRIVEMSTFGYRATLKELANLLLCDGSILWRYDVHFAALGSKIQTIGSWIFSRIVPSITFITSFPTLYHKKAISQGVGTSWVFELAPAFDGA